MHTVNTYWQLTVNTLQQVTNELAFTSGEKSNPLALSWGFCCWFQLGGSAQGWKLWAGTLRFCQARKGETKRPHSLLPARSASQDNYTFKMKTKKLIRLKKHNWGSHRGLCQSPHGHREPQQHVVLVGWQAQELRDPRESFRRRVPVQRLLLWPERGR